MGMGEVWDEDTPSNGVVLFTEILGMVISTNPLEFHPETFYPLIHSSEQDFRYQRTDRKHTPPLAPLSRRPASNPKQD
jgi:hypothetical protein